MGKLDGRVAVVTGASQGIGRGIALRFAAEGATAFIASRTQSRLDAVVADAAGLPGRLIGHACDLADRDQMFGLVQRAVDEAGGLDILVCNGQGFGTAQASTQGPVRRGIEDLDEDEWDYILRTGLTATMWLMKAAYPYLKASGRGRIITFGSGSGVLGTAGTAAYNSTKEAIRGLTRTVAHEWGKYRITANVINPAVLTEGSVSYMAQTPGFREQLEASVPLAALGRPDDVGAACVFLASDDAAFITGMTLMVDSGKNMYA
jgi:NAD(P)-dependent dehydrogenase (short-subunit alcohol dehydrogenase family)